MKLNHIRLATLITALVGGITMGACTMGASEAPAPAAAENLSTAGQVLPGDQLVSQTGKGKVQPVPFNPISPCSGLDGNYCARALGIMGSEVLFHCSSGTLISSEQCTNGCIDSGNESLCFVPGVLP